MLERSSSVFQTQISIFGFKYKINFYTFDLTNIFLLLLHENLIKIDNAVLLFWKATEFRFFRLFLLQLLLESTDVPRSILLSYACLYVRIALLKVQHNRFMVVLIIIIIISWYINNVLCNFPGINLYCV